MRDVTEPGLSFHPSARRVVRFGPYRTDFSDGSLWRGDQEVRLPPRALALLLYLLERPGRVVSKTELMDAVWRDANVSETSLTEALGIVRHALGDSAADPQFIQTLHRRGYRFIAPVTVELPASVPRAVTTSAAVAVAEPPAPAADKPGVRVAAFAAAAVLAGVVIAGSLWLAADRGRPEAVTRAVITLPSTQAPPISLSLYPIVALSPDGQDIVYVAGNGTVNQLFVRRMNQFEARLIPGTEGAHAPFFSPDGQHVGFFARRKIKTVALAGGEPVTVSDGQSGLGATWTRAGTIVFAPDWTSGLLEVDARGGTPRLLVPAPGGGYGYRWPQVLPDGDTVVATRWRADEQRASVVAISRAGGAPVTLVEGATSATYLPSRHLVYARRGNLFAASYTPGRPVGAERQVLDGVMTNLTGAAQYAVSRNESLVYVPYDGGRQDRRLFEVATDGSARALPHEARAYQEISVCDGKLATSIIGRTGWDIWIGTLAGGALTQLTQTGSAMDPVWRPGCEEIAYSSGNELYLQRADGSKPAERLRETSFAHAPTSWSPDGNRLVFLEVTPETRPDIWVLSIADKSAQPLVKTPAIEWFARVSPDGRWLAYQSNESGRYEIYVRPFAASGGRVQVSASGGAEPWWSDDGRTLYYVYRRTIHSVAIDPASGRPAPESRELLKRPELTSWVGIPGRNRFLIADRIREHLPITTLNLVVNWGAEIK